MLSLKGPLPYTVVSDTPDEYRRWKRSRQEIIATIDSQILNMNNDELAFLFDSWLSVARGNVNYNKPLDILCALMHLSVYFYYNRDLTSIEDLIPIVQNFFTHSNRVVVRVSACVVWWIAEEAYEAMDLFHPIVSEVPNWLCDSSKDQLVYAALCVLVSAYGQADKMVNDIVMKCFKNIFNIAFCEDSELQQLALDVLKQYFASSKPSKIETCYKSCINYALTKKDYCIKGAVCILRFWFSLKFQVDPEPILSVLNKIHANNETAGYIVELLNEISISESVDYTKSSFSKLFVTLLSTEDHMLIEIAKRIPVKNFPLKETIAKMKDKIKKNSLFAYQMITVVLKRNRNFNLPFKIPLNTEYPKEFIKLIECRSFVYEYKQQMAQFCQEEFTNPTQEKNLLAALRISKAFGRIIFKNASEIAGKIAEFTKSTNPVVRIAAVKAISRLPLPNATNVLLQIALLDVNPNVRMAAVRKLQVNKDFIDSPMSVQLFNDSNIEIKLLSLKLIDEANSRSPMMFYSDLFAFIRKTLENYSGLSDYKEISSYSRLFPGIGALCAKSYQSFMLELGRFCILFLSRGKYFSDSFNFYIDKENLCPPSEVKNSFSLKTEIYGSLFSNYIDERDINLIKTLKMVLPKLGSITKEIIDVFGHIIAGRKESVIKVTVSCLRKLLVLLPAEEFFANEHKEITTQLFKILSTTSNKSLAITIIKFLGSSGISNLPTNVEASDSTFASIDVNSQDFVFRSLMKAIIANLNPPPPSVFEAIKTIFRKEPIAALPYTPLVIPAFITAMQTATADTLEQLFSILDELALCTRHMLDEFAKDICDLIIKNLTLISCIKCTITLSYVLNSTMTPFMPPIFFRAVALTQNSSQISTMHQKFLLKLICFSVLYQNQPIHMFLTSCERCLHNAPLAVLNELIRIVQNSVSANNHGSRIARFFTDMYMFWGKDKALQLLYSLIYFRGINTSMARQIVKAKEIEDANLNILLEKTPEELIFEGFPSFMKRKKAIVKLPALHSQNNHSQVLKIFSEIKNPRAQSTNKWMYELCNFCITRSPSNLIQGMQKLVSDSIPFRGEILPIAFLTCFQKAPQSEKECFLSQLKEVFAINEIVDPAIYGIIDLLEMIGTDHGISNQQLAEKTDSPWRSIFYWRRLIIFPPPNVDFEPMLDKMYKMGRLATARGVLDLTGSNMDQKRCAMWRERVADWEGALKIYATYDAKADTIRCLGNLERWDEIKSMYPIFENLSYEDKQQTAPWFASAFYYASNFNEVDKLLSYFPEKEGLKYGFIKILTYIQENKFKEAKKVIATKFEILAENTAIYGGTNKHMAERYLIFAQHLIELREVIEVKESGKTTPPGMWVRRLSTFMGRGRDWRELSDIRNLLLPESYHSEVALKMAISLRKERRWGIIESIHKRMLLVSLTPDIIVERLRCQWLQGSKQKALKAICFIRDSYLAKTKQEIDSLFDRIPRVVFDDLISIYTTINPNSHITPVSIKQRWRCFIQKNKISPQMFASITRTASAWQIIEEELTSSELRTICDQLASALKDDENNQGTWFYYGFAKSLILNINDENNDKKQDAMDAINSLLHCESLQALNLLIWTLMNFPSEELLEKESLFKIPFERIVNALPQLKDALSSDNSIAKEIATKLILMIGENDIQSIIYHLKSVKCERAHEILEKLINDEDNGEIDRDASIFINFMRRISTTPIEQAFNIANNMLVAINTDNKEQLRKEAVKLKERGVCEQTSKSVSDILFLVQKEDEMAPFIIERYRREFESNFKYISSYIQPRGSEIQECSFKVSIPGHSEILIEHLNRMPVITAGTNRPRLIEISGSDGNKFKFRLNSTNMRKDQRIMQFSKVLCQMLKNTSHFRYAPPILNITPLGPHTGLVEVPKSAESMETIIKFFGEEREIEKSVIKENYGPSYPSKFTNLQMIELNDNVMKRTKGEELLETIWRNASAVSSWVSSSDTITQTYASQAIIGYIIGLEDRRLGNILVRSDNGYVVNIDFSRVFSPSQSLPRRAEQVPFRMTRSVRYLMDGANPYGLFQRTCENVLTFMQEKKMLLITQLSILTSTFSNADDIQKVSDKLSGVDKNIDDEQRSVTEHVSKLIEIASNRENSGSMEFDWCNFW